MIMLLLLHSSLSLTQAQPVDVERKTDWYCYSRSGRWFWPGQSLEEGCYRYVCEKDKGILRYWKPQVLSHCCARNGRAYTDGEIILEEMAQCREIRETCVL